MPIDMQKAATERYIDDLLSASEKPFDDRLQAVLYIYIVNMAIIPGGGQNESMGEARRLADWIRKYVYVDVDRKP